jgi:tryptophanyl-tRNA synthetase
VARECRAAEIGCVQDKALIADQIIEYLAPIREKRQALLEDRDTLLDILASGSRRARERARETMDSVRAALSIDHARHREESAD